MADVRRTKAHSYTSKMIEIAFRIEQNQSSGQDRIEIVRSGDSATVVLADGSGGISGGGEAADYVVNELVKKEYPQQAVVLMDELLRIDSELMQTPLLGESTVILITLEENQFTGAAVGDSEIYQFSSGELINLAEHKEPKPALGSTGCFPATFQGDLQAGRVLICSDGLWKYSGIEKIKASLKEPNLEVAADSLLECAKLPNGKLQDDVSLIVVQ